MIGKTISHYKILEKLGEGGMGVVYKAEDLKLKRTVALKFLPSELTRDPEAKERFIQEAQAASALDHPNICVIHEIDETEDGQMCICMAYYDGETLKKKVSSNQLSVNSVIDIAIQIAQGLVKAHEHGIIHRDIKPGNIMITKDGMVKILDFGLAKLAGQVGLTKTGTTIGTIAYMSPEQARGKDVDHRTDIWSFGVVFYEMITGQLPFKGEYEQAVIYSIINEEPDSVKELRPDCPDSLVNITIKCLQKEAAHRFQWIQEIIDEMEKPTLSNLAIEKKTKSIAVLPFEDLSPDKDNEYFSDGLTEEVIADLSQLQDLRVISRSSVMTLKGTNKNISTIGKELNVQFILEGSVRKAGNNLRITAQLIDAITDAHLWAEKYSGTLDDVFEIQEQVSSSIVAALKLKLSPEEMQKLAERPIDNIHAYECYLKARQGLWHMTAESLDSAIQEVKNGIEIIGENELLYAVMGYIYLEYIAFGIRPNPDYLDEAEKCVNKIFALNPNSSRGYVLRGMLYYFKWKNLQEAVRNLKRALEIDPSDPDALTQIILMYLTSGKEAVAKPLIKKLLELDPLTPINHNWPGLMALMEGRIQDAAESHGKMYQMAPYHPFLRMIYAMVLARAQRLDEAYFLLDITIKDSPNTPFAKHSEFLNYALQGDKQKALDSVTPEFKKMCTWDEYSAWYMASAYSLIDAKEEALDWLEISINKGFINYHFLNEYDPFLQNIRGEKRFKKLMEEVKYEWENFEV